MQEVQSNHFADFLQPELQKHGYTAIYKKKTTELYTGSAYAIDGCATFFRRDRFALVKKYEVGINVATGPSSCYIAFPSPDINVRYNPGDFSASLCIVLEHCIARAMRTYTVVFGKSYNGTASHLF